MDFRKTIKIEDRAPIATWLGDSQVWMKTALDKDRHSGRGRSGVEHNRHELNVAYVCAGLAFELVLKALAKSEGRTATKKHDAGRNYQNLRAESQRVIQAFVEEHTGKTIGDFLAYLDEHMCHPDRKYWMVGKRGEMRSVGFLIGDEHFVIPALATVHAKIADIVGGNTFEAWRSGTHVRADRGEHLARGHVDPDGSIKFEITEAGMALGVSKITGKAEAGDRMPFMSRKALAEGQGGTGTRGPRDLYDLQCRNAGRRRGVVEQGTRGADGHKRNRRRPHTGRVNGPRPERARGGNVTGLCRKPVRGLLEWEN